MMKLVIIFQWHNGMGVHFQDYSRIQDFGADFSNSRPQNHEGYTRKKCEGNFISKFLGMGVQCHDLFFAGAINFQLVPHKRCIPPPIHTFSFFLE